MASIAALHFKELLFLAVPLVPAIFRVLPAFTIYVALNCFMPGTTVARLKYS